MLQIAKRMTGARNTVGAATRRVTAPMNTDTTGKFDLDGWDVAVATMHPRCRDRERPVIFRIARTLCVFGTALLAACANTTPPVGTLGASPSSVRGSAYTPPADALAGTVPRETVLSPTASIFPLDRYDQNVDRWIDPSRADYRLPLLPADVQQRALQSLLAGYFGPADDPARTRDATSSARALPSGVDGTPVPRATQSPWDPHYVTETLDLAGRLALTARIEGKLRQFSTDAAHAGFGQNLRPHPDNWLATIRANIDLPALFEAKDDAGADGTAYRAQRRAISVMRASVRLLPTDDPSFYDPRLPGEGYPFDNLQESTIAPGTPLYIVGQTRDRAWAYVLSPGLTGWVRSDTIGVVDASFVRLWRRAAYTRLLAVTARDSTLIDAAGVFRFDAPVGTVLPAGPTPGSVLAPALDIHRHAVIVAAVAPASQWQAMPLSPSPQNMAMLIKALQGRPYGWGGTGFYNDCSLDLHDLMMPFGLVLPRHSSFQVEGPAMVDLSDDDEHARLAFLMTHGRPFFTIIHIAGHVMLYLGNGIVDGKQVPMVYEDMWGLAPSDRSRRAIVGQSAIMPLLSTFPEDPTLQGQAGGKIFRLGFHAQGLGPLPLSEAPQSPATNGTAASSPEAKSPAGVAASTDTTVTPDTPADGH
jgi:cell wall-associated NlpC family hydrolase